MNFKKAAAIAATAGALTALALPALAETSFYGSPRVATFYNSVDKATGGTASNNSDITNFDQHLQSNIRLV